MLGQKYFDRHSKTKIKRNHQSFAMGFLFVVSSICYNQLHLTEKSGSAGVFKCAFATFVIVALNLLGMYGTDEGPADRLSKGCGPPECSVRINIEVSGEYTIYNDL